MSDDSKAVPRGRGRRLGKFARLAGGVAGSMIGEGMRQLGKGNRPRARDLLLTPANARRLTRQLSEMRGAAMKLGQILSMDNGDFLPRELADALAALRSSAFAMPDHQLDEMLLDAFGEGYEGKLRGFERRPFAAASIGQVHRVSARDGSPAVLKIQYPGIRESIDSDVDNLTTLLRVSGLLPRHIDVTPLLTEVKRQLREEADYEQEARYLKAFVRALGEDGRFVLPRVIPSLTAERVLGMTFVSGGPIESLAGAEQSERDRVMALLFELLFRELFDLRLVQTDPNFANYRYDPDTGQVALLDFGASRRFRAGFVRDYRTLLQAVVAQDRSAIARSAQAVGYHLGPEDSRYHSIVLDLAQTVLAPVLRDEVYDFGSSTLPAEAADLADALKEYRQFWEAPPVDAVYLHRKAAGLFMLAARLEARVNVRGILNPWLAVD